MTTHSRLLVEALQSMGASAERVKEPSDGPVGGLIRGFLRGGAPQPLMALLFAADRLHSLHRRVLRLLEEGAVVVYDRYKYSSLVYQTTPLDGEPPPPEWVASVNAYAPPAHLLILLDVEPRVAAARLAGRSSREVYENLPLLEKLRRGFSRLLGQLLPEHPPRCSAPLWRGVHRLWETLPLPPGLYPGGLCYPLRVLVRGTLRGVERSVEDVAADVLAATVAALHLIRGAGPPRWTLERLEEGRRRGSIELVGQEWGRLPLDLWEVA